MEGIIIAIFALFVTFSHTVDAQTTKFSCNGRVSGYYADVGSGCQVYHMCDGLGRQFSYTCPNATLFQQRMLICDHWYMVNCSRAEHDYAANLRIGQRGQPFVDDDTDLRTPRPDLGRRRPSQNEYDIIYRTGRAQYNNGINLVGADSDKNDGSDQYFGPSHWSTHYVNDRSNGKDDRASVNNDRASVNNDRSSIDNTRTSAHNDRNSVNNDRTSTTNGRISINNGRTSVNNGKATVNGRTNVNNDRQRFNNDRTSVNNDRINVNNIPPRANNDRNSVNNERIIATNDRISVNNGRTSANNDRTSVNDDRTSVNNDRINVNNEEFSINNDMTRIKQRNRIRTSIPTTQVTEDSNEKINENERSSDSNVNVLRTTQQESKVTTRSDSNSIKVNYESQFRATTPVYPTNVQSDVKLAEGADFLSPPKQNTIQSAPKVVVNYKSQFEATTPVYPTNVQSDVKLAEGADFILPPKIAQTQSGPKSQTEPKVAVNFESRFKATTPVYPTNVQSDVKLSEGAEFLAPPSGPVTVRTVNFESDFQATTPVYPTKVQSDVKLSEGSDLLLPPVLSQLSNDVTAFGSQYKATTPVYPKVVDVASEEPSFLGILPPELTNQGLLEIRDSDVKNNDVEAIAAPSKFYQPPKLEPDYAVAPSVRQTPNWIELRRKLLIPDYEFPLETASRISYDGSLSSFDA